jgi:predicted component of type VI protein secretion system
MIAPTFAELEVESSGVYSLDRLATIGRAPESTIVLKLPSISRHHARIFLEGGHFWIKDLDSANGTTVNGRRTKLQMLSDNDKIVFGEAKAVFRTKAKSSWPAPLAQDPMEGAEQPLQDGTPTSGLIFPAPHSARKMQESGIAQENPDAEATASEYKPGEHLGEAKARMMWPDREIHSSQRGLEAAPADHPDMAGLREENARLKRLVTQLERALADSNLRLRNMQKRLDRTK